MSHCARGRQRCRPLGASATLGRFAVRAMASRPAFIRPYRLGIPNQSVTSAESRMANQGVNQGRRRFLTATTAVVGGAGVAIAAVPFLRSWQPSARAEVAGAPVTENISRLEPGQRMTVTWRGQPVFVIRRTPEQLAALETQEGRLRDP